jgi:hypothetical protein
MRTKKWIPLLALVALAATTTACFHAYGSRRYPDSPRYAANVYSHIALLRHEPRRPYVELGEVWIRPEPWMGRRDVEGLLRSKTARLGGDALVIVEDRYLRGNSVRRFWRGRRAVGKREIVGIAIRYRR